MTEITRCQHCRVVIFDNPHSDPTQAALASLCWNCVKPWKGE